MSPADVQRNLAEAYRLFAARDLDAAERTLESVLKTTPNEVNALNMMAGIRRARGDFTGALALFDAAIKRSPGVGSVLFNRANLLLEIGRSADALAGYDAAIAARPEHAESYINRGRALVVLARHDEALASLERAHRLGFTAPALHHVRALALTALGRNEEALAIFEAIAHVAPNLPDAHYNRGRCLQALDRPLEALAAYERATQLDPNNAALWDSRGLALYDLDRSEEALASFARAFQLRPQNPETLANQGLALFALKRPKDSIAAFDAALARGDDPAIRCHRAITLLATHDLRAGWPGFEARREAGLVSTPAHDRNQPRWKGDRVKGALRIWPEEGIGAEVMFARLAPLARAHTQPVILECAPRLAPLFARSFPDIEVSTEPRPAGAQIAAASIGAVLNISAQDIGGSPYLRADASKRKTLRARYESLARGRPIIGIAWSSSSPWRTAPLEHWSAVLSRDYLFVTLQSGDVVEQVALAQARHNATIITDAAVNQSVDLDAFAAQIASMDTVISATSTATHFAGALGVKCIALIPPGRGRHWCWGFEGDRTPWYDSVRVVRRDAKQRWSDQVAAAAALL